MTNQRPVSGGEPFSRRSVLWISGIASVSFLAALFFWLFGDELATVPSHGSDSFSRSAIGHHAFAELLEDLGIPVVISQHESATRAGDTGVLVVAEPHVYDVDGPRGKKLREFVGEASTILVVLPKWTGDPEPLNPSWIERADLLPTYEVAHVLEAMEMVGEVVRPGDATGWSTSGHPPPDLFAPQLVTSQELRPIVWSDQGVLLGESNWHSGRVWILSDPDVLSNHGLGRGQNALISVGIVEDLRDGDGPVIFDETLHGFEKEPDLWRALFEFPLVLAMITGFLSLVFLLWAAMGRFGAPLPPEPAIEPGKGFLIRNTGALLRFGGHTQHALSSYLHTAVQDVGKKLHAPADASPGQLRAWLERMGKSRGLAVSLSDLEREVASASRERATRTVVIANRIHQWKQEMLHGPGHRTGRQQRPS